MLPPSRAAPGGRGPRGSAGLVRESVLGAARVLALWGMYLALQLFNEGRPRCRPEYIAILATQARASSAERCGAHCVAGPLSHRREAHARRRRQVVVGVAALALAMWLANRVFRAGSAARDLERGARERSLAGDAAAEGKPAADAGAAAAPGFDEPDYTVRGLLHTSAYALLAGVLAGARPGRIQIPYCVHSLRRGAPASSLHAGLRRRQAARRQGGFRGSLSMRKRNSQSTGSARPPRACVTAAPAAPPTGLLGIGGGSIISPLLIELNVNPAVGGATASLMVVFSGSLSLLSYALSGSLNVVYGAIYGVTAFVAAAVGATVIGHIVRRTGKASRGACLCSLCPLCQLVA